MNNKKPDQITAGMTVLDIVSQYPATVAVFRSYDEQAGDCICCQMLFETVLNVAESYQLNLTELLTKLNGAIQD